MSARYVLGSLSANSASRVADSKRIGSTPVASGSRVPAWPTRRAPVTSRSRRTTLNEVAPFGLSTFRIPARIGDRLLGCGEHQLDGFRHRLFDLGPRRAEVAATAELGAEGSCVDLAPAPDADLRHPFGDLFEDD